MTQIKAHEIQYEHKKTHFYCVRHQNQEQVAQTGSGICVLGDIQSLAGPGAE